MSEEVDQKFSYNAAKVVPSYLGLMAICASVFLMDDWPSTYMKVLKEPPGAYFLYLCGIVLACGLLRYLPEFLMSITKHAVVTVGKDYIKVSAVRERIYSFSGPDTVLVQYSSASGHMVLSSERNGKSNLSLSILNDSPILVRVISEKVDVVDLR